jgi:F0F1-type ATP synthase epsilon subunit
MAEINQLRVRLVTPERILVEQNADSVELPAKTGYMEVLYGHAPLLAELGAGDVTLHGASNGPDGGENAGKSDRYNVSWGFVEVLPDRVTTQLCPHKLMLHAQSSNLITAMNCGPRLATMQRNMPRPTT